MPRKLRCSLTILAAIALVAAFASSAAQAQSKNATGPTKGTDIRPWTTTHGSNRSVGRNDGYVQQPKTSKQGGATKKGSQPAKVRATPAVQLNRYAN